MYIYIYMYIVLNLWPIPILLCSSLGKGDVSTVIIFPLFLTPVQVM